MFTVCVRDQFMIAHSLKGEVFGPAQRLHGATYVVDVEMRRHDLDEANVVVDRTKAVQALRAVLSELNYRNLDQEPVYAGENTTAEFLARDIFERMAARIDDGDLGEAAHTLAAMRVTLKESPVARVSYEAPLHHHNNTKG